MLTTSEHLAQQVRPGGFRELWRLALPLILSASFWNLQIFIDRVLLSRYSSDCVAASMAAGVLFWTPFALLQFTTMYATTFVAQYLGAGRRERIGPAVWQGIHFSVLAGIAFMGLAPLKNLLVSLSGHEPALQALEADYFHCLCFAALPMLLTAATSAFFIGRGDNWTVMLLNAVGLVVNAVLDYGWIYGHWGFPEAGIVGAGWATVIGSWASAAVGFGLLMMPEFRKEFATLSGWKLERELFGRMMKFGLPSGFQVFLEVLAFNFFILFLGRMGKVELAASSIAFTINMIAVLPMMGTAQAVSSLVGRRLGEDRPDLAESSTYWGFRFTWVYMAVIATLYIVFPNQLAAPFASQGESEAATWEAVSGMVPILLRFVAFYAFFDGMMLIVSFALKGAGDTRFVSLAMLVLPWPIMVGPTWLALHYGWGLYWAWAFASAFVVTIGLVFLLRFRGGKWKAMRVIETVT